jgi:LysM repeat protein
MHYKFMLIFLALLAAACTLTTNQPTEVADIATSTPREADEPVATDSPRPTQPPSPTSTLGPTNTPRSGSTGCLPRTDWANSYTVVAGDTLANIARRANSSVSELAQGNCLADANTIAVGQRLRVPRPVAARLPPTITPPPNAPIQRGAVSISSTISGDAGNWLLLRDDSVTLSWDGAPSMAAVVTFTLLPPGWRSIADGLPSGILIADNNVADGAAGQWRVPGGVRSQLAAFAYARDNTLLAYSYAVSVYSAPPKGQGCEVAPKEANGQTAFMKPDPNAGVFGTLPQDQYVEVLGRSLSGWYAFDPGVAGAGETGVARLRWLPLNSPLLFKGNCPDQPANPPPTKTYSNADLGIALDYPGDWTVLADANYVDFRGPTPRVFEITFSAVGEAKNPADAAADCKSAGACIGNRTVTSEGPVILPSGLTGYRLDLSAALGKDANPAVYVFLAIKNRTLIARGFGGGGDFDPILNTLRPV